MFRASNRTELRRSLVMAEGKDRQRDSKSRSECRSLVARRAGAKAAAPGHERRNRFDASCPSFARSSFGIPLERSPRCLGLLGMLLMPETNQPSYSRPTRATTSEAITNNVRVEVESQYAPGAIAAISELLVLPLHGADYQRRRRNRAAAELALDRDRRVRPRAGSPKAPACSASSRCWLPASPSSNTSGWPLKTSQGELRGTYQMVSEGGAHFDAEIAPFALYEPYTVH